MRDHGLVSGGWLLRLEGGEGVGDACGGVLHVRLRRWSENSGGGRGVQHDGRGLGLGLSPQLLDDGASDPAQEVPPDSVDAGPEVLELATSDERRE